MEINITWFEGKYPSFNVGLASKPGSENFLEIKGCRIVSGSKGDFVSPPSTKGKNDKYWNHAYFSPDFGKVILEKALESRPKETEPKPVGKKDPFQDFDSIPF